jgi:hypothetical protein
LGEERLALDLGGPLFWTIVIGLFLSPLLSFLLCWAAVKRRFMTRGHLVLLTIYYVIVIGGIGQVYVFGERGFDAGPADALLATLQHAGCLGLLGGPVIALIFAGRAVYIGSHLPRGICRACGYNLTANRSGTCPECGKPTPP